jgi:hypothetical protein
MKNFFLLKIWTLCFSFLALTAYGQSQWIRQSPIPAGNNLRGVSWTSPEHASIAGEAATETGQVFFVSSACSRNFGLGEGSGAHAPDEYYIIESANPKIQDFDGAVMSFVEYLHELAK